MRPHGQNNLHAQLESWVVWAEALGTGESATAAVDRGHGILGGLCRLTDGGLHE